MTVKQFVTFLVVALVVTGVVVSMLGNGRTANIVGPIIGLGAGLWAGSSIER
jgi:hypothetical protein